MAPAPPLPRRSITAQISEVEREIGERRRVYDRLVSMRKMKQGEADEKIILMQNVLETLRKVERYRDTINKAIGAEPKDNDT